MTRGEGGISSPEEDSASIPTPTEPRQRPSWQSQQRSWCKGLQHRQANQFSTVTHTVIQRSTAVHPSKQGPYSMANLEQSFLTPGCQLLQSPSQGRPCNQKRPQQSALRACSGTSLHFHLKPGLLPGMPLFLCPSETKPHQLPFRV